MKEKLAIQRKLGVETSKCCGKCGKKGKVMKFISKVVVGRKFQTDTYQLCYNCYDNIVGDTNE